MKSEDMVFTEFEKMEEDSDIKDHKEADAIFTCKPEVRNGAIENYGNVWVILNISHEELDDFFREGLEVSSGDSWGFPIKSDPKPVICLGIRGSSILLMSEMRESSDFLLSKIISKERNKRKGTCQ